MTQKPEIQYIGQFYVYGSEAEQPQLEVKEKRAHLPMITPVQKLEIRLDPVAIVSLFAAVVVLLVMVTGTIRIQESWREYDTMRSYMSLLRAENAELRTDYRESFNPEEIQSTAMAMGLVPVSELKTMDVTVTVPEREEEPGFFEEAWEDILWHIDCLFE